jgi:hypothetical protein
MDALRLVAEAGGATLAPCSRCQASGCPWDWVADKPICPDCQELLALGEGDPLVEPLQPRRCAVCRLGGTVCYRTFPLQSPTPVEIDLCPGHFRALLARRLDRHSFRRLAKQLRALRLSVQQLFLLHDAFYDDKGRPLQPVPEL